MILPSSSRCKDGSIGELMRWRKNHASFVAEDRLLRAIIDPSAEKFDFDGDQKNLFNEEHKDRIENYHRITAQLQQARLIVANTKQVLEAHRRPLASGAGSKWHFWRASPRGFKPLVK